MSLTLQQFFADGARKAAEDLEAAVLRIPEDKRAWSPMGDARTALDQAAECAILCGSTAKLIQTRSWDSLGSMDEYFQKKAELAKDWGQIQATLKENSAKVADTIRGVPDADLGVEIAMPWGPMTIAQVISYPYWNMSYHLGQINYIAIMLGVDVP